MMSMATAVGIAVGIVAVVLAVAVTIWAIRMSWAVMRGSPTQGATVVDQSTLRAMFLQLNQAGQPFRVSEPDQDHLVIEWIIADARWIEVLGTASENMTYQAWLELDNATRTVKYHERIYHSSVSAGGAMALFTESSSSRGFEIWGRRQQHRWGINQDLEIREIYEYDFSPAEIKDVIRQIANDHGWSFELTLRRPGLTPTFAHQRP